jgi:nucleotide-binding universal stress UspA family protein
MAKRILLPLDTHERTEAVLPLVAAMARGGGATVRLLHVAPLPELRTTAYGRVVAYTDQESERLEGQALDYLRTVEARLEGVPVEMRVRFGDAREEIPLEAEAFGADLIALTTAKPRRLLPALLGGIARRVRRKTRVAVMLLSPGAGA